MEINLFSKCIKDLIVENDRVDVPYLGTFRAEMMPASYSDRQTTLDLSYSYIHQDKDPGEGIVSQYALEYLRHKFVARLNTSLWRQLSLSLSLRWQDREGQYTTFSGDVEDYRPYALVDARLQWQQRRYTLFAELNNVFDNRSYVDYGNVPQPGAWWVAGISYRW